MSTETGSFDRTAGSRPPAHPSTAQPLSLPGDELAAAQAAGVAPASQSAPAHQSHKRRSIKCRFFGTKKGCRAGAACPYIHDVSVLDSTQAVDEQRSDSGSLKEDHQRVAQGVTSGVQHLSLDGQPSKQGSASPSTSQSRRPVSTAEQANPRDFQINQMRRRFRPQETSDDMGTRLTFGLVPSDPDFPFELASLKCVLHVPHSYPEKGRPTLKVTNPEMDPAFQANVARGFDDIVDFTMRTAGRGTLLNWMNSLDRQLERLLTTLEKGPKLKFVANTRTGTAEIQPAHDIEKVPSQITAPAQRVAAPNLSPNPPVAAPTYTIEEKAQAEKRKTNDTKQTEARFRRLPLFEKRSDGSFIVPIQPNKQDRLPRALQAVKTVKLNVPPLYPLEHSSIEIQGVDGPEARAVELGFAQWVEQHSQMSLVSQINYLASNMHNFANAPLPEVPEDIQSIFPVESSVPAQSSADASVAADDDDRPHLHVIPRPPEWSVPEHSGDETTSESSYEDELSEEEEEEEDEEGGAAVPATVEKPPGRGVALSFPFLELYGIELLELVNLCITVKCERCKESLDVKNVPQAKDQQGVSPKTESCKKCANPMSISFRRQLMHSHSNRAGYLDLDGCTVGDLLPSNFIPTCAECSTAHPAPGVSAVRGESAMAICRQCHRKMVFKIPEVKFLVVGTAAVSSRGALPLRKKPKEVLGIVAGQELPRRGRCQHYGKSYRWFRFSCCSKVFPCDKCHDAETDHPNEHANRMICGFCSREQIYRPESCAICKAVLVGKAGSGFWEGGKGTRNRALMSRKDPRKYKRIGGNVPGGAKSSKRK